MSSPDAANAGAKKRKRSGRRNPREHAQKRKRHTKAKEAARRQGNLMTVRNHGVDIGEKL